MEASKDDVIFLLGEKEVRIRQLQHELQITQIQLEEAAKQLHEMKAKYEPEGDDDGRDDGDGGDSGPGGNGRDSGGIVRPEIWKP